MITKISLLAQSKLVRVKHSPGVSFWRNTNWNVILPNTWCKGHKHSSVQNYYGILPFHCVKFDLSDWKFYDYSWKNNLLLKNMTLIPNTCKINLNLWPMQSWNTKTNTSKILKSQKYNFKHSWNIQALNNSGLFNDPYNKKWYKNWLI